MRKGEKFEADKREHSSWKIKLARNENTGNPPIRTRLILQEMKINSFEYFFYTKPFVRMSNVVFVWHSLFLTIL